MLKEAKSSGLLRLRGVLLSHADTHTHTQSAHTSGCRDQPRKQCCSRHPHRHQQHSHRRHHHWQQVLFLLSSSPGQGFPNGHPLPASPHTLFVHRHMHIRGSLKPYSSLSRSRLPRVPAQALGPVCTASSPDPGSA